MATKSIVITWIDENDFRIDFNEVKTHDIFTAAGFLQAEANLSFGMFRSRQLAEQAERRPPAKVTKKVTKTTKRVK